MKPIKQKSNDILENLALRATRFIGSTTSLFVHTILFIFSFVLYFFGIAFDKILLVLTTILSLEAIYLSIFIQMSVNRHTDELQEVAQDVEEIQEDVEGIEKDVDEIQKDVDEIQEDVEDIQEEDEQEDKKDDMTLTRIQATLEKLMNEIAELKKQDRSK